MGIEVLKVRDVMMPGIGGPGSRGASLDGDTPGEVLVSVEPDDGVLHAIRLMKETLVRRIPVTDPDGRLVGIVALADIARHPGAGAQPTTEDPFEEGSEPPRLSIRA